MAYQQIPVRTINSTTVVPIINASPQAATTGTITTSSSVITATDLQGVGSATVSIYGTFAGVNATFEGYDGINWFAIPAKNATTVLADASTTTGVIATAQYYNVAPLLGVQQLRVRATAYTSGTANVIIEPSTQFVNNIQQVVGAVTTSGTVTATVASTTLTSVVPGVAATSLGKAEDAVHASGDTGVMVLGVRNDNAATAMTSANGDYSSFSGDINGTQFVRDAPSNTATKSNVAGAITSTTILAANPARRTAVIYNDSTSDMYLSYGGTASSTSFTVLVVSFQTVTILGSEYAGALVGIWNTAVGSARVTETSI